jgi:uncharacterized RDD family membrane protein YckC
MAAAGKTGGSGPRHLRPRRNRLQLVTPEGVPLSLDIALAGDRLAAFLIDSLFIGVAGFCVVFLAMLSGLVEAYGLTMIILFLLRNFYFMFFEQTWQGATPGKRNRKLRVVDYRGGQLTVEAVIVRNLTRDIEIFLPLTVFMYPEVVWPGAPPLAAPVAGLWALVLGLMPLLNRNRRRVGDLIAGTVVIAAPQVELLGDLAESRTATGAAPVSADHAFSQDQLGIYGVYELQVLEKVLRRSGYDSTAEQMALIREKICAKIGWTEPVTDDYGFLKAFYAAQRAHLEGRLLMGDRREDKFSGRETEQ